MPDRQKIEAMLSRRFPAATPGQVAAAANAIMGLDDEWEEVRGDVERPDCCYSGPGGSTVCDVTRGLEDGGELRLFRRRLV